MIRGISIDYGVMEKAEDGVRDSRRRSAGTISARGTRLRAFPARMTAATRSPGRSIQKDTRNSLHLFSGQGRRDHRRRGPDHREYRRRSADLPERAVPGSEGDLRLPQTKADERIPVMIATRPRILLLVAVVVVLAGCAGSYPRFQPCERARSNRAIGTVHAIGGDRLVLRR